MNALFRIVRNEKAATAVEYGLILALVVLGVVGALSLFATSANNLWNSVSSAVITNG
jgi:pilus assembly protein Flp/PilA